MQISILKISELENEFTIGAEFYLPYYTELVNKIKEKNNIRLLGDICTRITDGDHSATQYTNEGILYLLSESVKEGYIDKTIKRYISPELHSSLKRSQLKAGDVLLTKTGVYFGKSAVVPDNFPEANTSAHVGRFVVKKKIINPYYLSVFFNCKYGYSQIRRRGIKASRPEIKLVEFNDIKIVIASKEFQDEIEKVSRAMLNILDTSNSIFKEAHNLLLSELGLSDWKPKRKLSFIRNYYKTQQAERFDAEYFQPKYEDIVTAVKSYYGKCDNAGNVLIIKDKNINPKAKKEYCYIELSNIGENGEITDCTKAEGQELPTRARRKVATGDVIVSSIEGSLSSIALITDEFNNALCSTGFYVVKSSQINSESLLVLMTSIVGQMQLKKGCSGTILTAINKEELEKITLPIIDIDIQQQIQQKVAESFNLRKKARYLMECAKTAVEIAIENDEDSAIKWLKTQNILV